MLNKAWIEELAEKYDEENKKEKFLEKKIFECISEVGSPPRYLTTDILVKIAEWKAARVKGYVDRNRSDEQFVKDVTQVSLLTKNERLRLEALTLLSGVNIRMASAILFFCFPERYTVMDWRAWKSLKTLGKLNGEIKDNFDCWKKYNDVCRQIAGQFGVSLRKLDKALWMFKGETSPQP